MLLLKRRVRTEASDWEEISDLSNETEPERIKWVHGGIDIAR
jgi:hypothetical protein